MYSAYALIFAIVCPALAGLVGMAAPRRAIGLRVCLSVAAPAVSLALLARHAIAYGTNAGPAGFEWMPSLQLALTLHPDRLGLIGRRVFGLGGHGRLGNRRDAGHAGQKTCQ